jgi:hypothetical protein
MLNNTERDAVIADLGPGFCPCCEAALERCGCDEWLPCGECSATVHACSDEATEPTTQIPAETMAQVVEGRL